MAIRIAGTLFAIHIHIGAWVGSIDLDRCAVAGVVVGQCKVNFTVAVVDSAPLWTIHLGGTQRIGCMARIDQHVGLVGEAVSAVVGDARVCDGHLNPLAFAIRIELRHIQLAL